MEVVSPGDTAAEVDEKARMWLDYGSRLVRVVLHTLEIPAALADFARASAAGGEEGEDARSAALRGPPRIRRGSGLRGRTRSAHAGEDLPPRQVRA